MARQLQYPLADGPPLWNIAEGFDRSVVPTRISELGLHEAYNVVLVDGRIQPRPRARETSFVYQPAGAPAGPCNYLGLLQRSWGGSHIYRGEADFGAGTMDLYHWDSATPQWDSTLTGATTSRDTPPTSVQFKNTGIFIPGDGLMYEWDASSFLWADIDSLQATADLRPPNKARFVVATGSRVFAANGMPAGLSSESDRITYRVWWSTTGNSRIWSNGTGVPERGSASYQDLHHDSYPITGMIFHSGQATMVWKTWSIYLSQWRGSPMWYDFVPLTTAIGCIAGHTIKKWRNWMLFLGSDLNVYAIGLQGEPQPLGAKVQPYIQDIADLAKVHRSLAMVDYQDNLYWLILPATTDAQEDPQHLLCLNLETGAWTEGKIAGFQITSAFTYQPPSGPQRMMLGASDGKIYEFDYQTALADGATNWSAYVWSRVYDFAEAYKDLGETGEIHKVMLHGEAGAATARTRIGKTVKQVLAASPTVFGEVDLTVGSPITYVDERTNAERFAQWGILWGAGEADPMEVEGVTVWALPRGANR
jgi:hypothetical protein